MDVRILAWITYNIDPCERIMEHIVDACESDNQIIKHNID